MEGIKVGSELETGIEATVLAVESRQSLFGKKEMKDVLLVKTGSTLADIKKVWTSNVGYYKADDKIQLKQIVSKVSFKIANDEIVSGEE